MEFAMKSIVPMMEGTTQGAAPVELPMNKTPPAVWMWWSVRTSLAKKTLATTVCEAMVCASKNPGSSSKSTLAGPSSRSSLGDPPPRKRAQPSAAGEPFSRFAAPSGPESARRHAAWRPRRPTTARCGAAAARRPARNAPQSARPRGGACPRRSASPRRLQPAEIRRPPPCSRRQRLPFPVPRPVGLELRFGPRGAWRWRWRCR